LFNWLIEKINKRLACKTTGEKLVIGVLDIYGFEIFEVPVFAVIANSLPE
jgi:myosin heavy subunit